MPTMPNQRHNSPLRQPAASSRLRQSSRQPRLATSSGSPVKVNVLVAAKEPRPPKRRSNFWAIAAVMLGTTGLLVGSGWLSIRLIVNPGSVTWLSWMMPEWNRGYLSKNEPPKTLAEIQTAAEKAGLFAGSPLYLSVEAQLSPSEAGANDLLMPIYKRQSHCDDPSALSCRQMTELRVYRPQQPSRRLSRRGQTFALIDSVAIEGPQELAAIAPIAQSASTSPGSTRRLPFNTIDLIEGQANAAGVWLNLSGEWSRGSTGVVYGRVVRYSPDRARLDLLLPWTSPARERPKWQEITGGQSAELIVNQTLGLEPNFLIYQIKTRSSPTASARLEPISLSESVLQGSTYEDALFLARSGLWSPALQLMNGVKGQIPDEKWPATAQAQLDAIDYHARITQAQADQTWASPSQHITAHIIDGRWAAAMAAFEAAGKDGYELTNVLKVDSDRLWRRVEATLRVNSNQPYALFWGALIVSAQQGRSAAIAWAREQNQGVAVAYNSRIQAALSLLDRPSTPTIVTAGSGGAGSSTTSPAANPVSQHDSQLIGTATPFSTVNPAEWSRPQSNLPLTLSNQQTWYQIRVSNFYDGQRWRRSPFSDLSATASNTQRLWDMLGLSSTPDLQILIWADASQPQMVQATIKAVQVRGGVLHLLASGDALSASPAASGARALAMTLTTLPWLESAPLTLASLHQQNPNWVAAFTPIVQQELQASGQDISIPVASSAELPPEIQGWPVQLIDLTGNGQSEAIITLQPPSATSAGYDAIAISTEPGSSRTQTLILSDQGRIIYSELTRNSGQTFMGLVSPQGDGTPALVIQDGQDYHLWRWSTVNQRFE